MTPAAPFKKNTARAAIVLMLGVMLPSSASAYIGPSFLQLPENKGGWRGEPYRNWIRANSNYWGSAPPGVRIGGQANSFPGPMAPRQGAGSLIVAIDKHSPAFSALMRKCRDGTRIDHIAYAESSELSRSAFEIGSRPSSVPQYYEYRLTDARIADCPVVADAPEQAFIIRFEAIQWLNYSPTRNDAPSQFTPVALTAATDPRTTRSFVVSWFGVANDVSSDQCPTMAAKPSQEAYFAFLPPDSAQSERAKLAPTGGPSFGNNQMALRGPLKLDVTKLPGIVPDPGQPMPKADLARGVDLDGDGGNAKPRTGVRGHVNYRSPDGRAGIDNQLYSVEGCIPGRLGHRGFAPQFSNGQMRDGAFSILIEISGVDDPRNDDSVELSWFYSLDPMAKSGSGTTILADYTFRLTDNPLYASYFNRVHGRIVDGVVTTDPINRFPVYMGRFGFPSESIFYDARLRLELQPDGGLKGVLGGYLSLWRHASMFTSSQGEDQWGFQAPATYNALRRAADGLRNPASGEYEGISAAYDIEAVPAFIARERVPARAAQSLTHAKAR